MGLILQKWNAAAQQGLWKLFHRVISFQRWASFVKCGEKQFARQAGRQVCSYQFSSLKDMWGHFAQELLALRSNHLCLWKWTAKEKMNSHGKGIISFETLNKNDILNLLVTDISHILWCQSGGRIRKDQHAWNYLLSFYEPLLEKKLDSDQSDAFTSRTTLAHPGAGVSRGIEHQTHFRQLSNFRLGFLSVSAMRC